MQKFQYIIVPLLLFVVAIFASLSVKTFEQNVVDILPIIAYSLLSLLVIASILMKKSRIFYISFFILISFFVLKEKDLIDNFSMFYINYALPVLSIFLGINMLIVMFLKDGGVSSGMGIFKITLIILEFGTIFYLSLTQNSVVMDYFYLEILPSKYTSYFAFCDIAVISTFVSLIILAINYFFIKANLFNGINFMNMIILACAINFSDNMGIFSIFLIAYVLSNIHLLISKEK